MMHTIVNENQLLTRLTQMSELLDQERNAIVNADTDMLEHIAVKKSELTNILASVSPALLNSLKSAAGDDVSDIQQQIKDLIAKSSARNSINGSMLTQARNMTEKSIGILLSCSEKNPVELYDEHGKVPDAAKKRALGAA
jgi:flagellar biosynthesis/type III secretory pathway chaperone